MSFLNPITLLLAFIQLGHTHFRVRAFTTTATATYIVTETAARRKQGYFHQSSNENALIHLDNKAIVLSDMLGTVGRVKHHLHHCYSRKQNRSFILPSLSSSSSNSDEEKVEKVETACSNIEENNQEDTIRVRIWRALILKLTSDSKGEITLKELGAIVGQRNLGDLRDHLSHVETQAKTLKNKSKEWRLRRGFPEDWNKRKIDKLRLITRKGKKNIVYIKLG